MEREEEEEDEGSSSECIEESKEESISFDDKSICELQDAVHDPDALIPTNRRR
eukprot:CAMPEP_0176378776 /NCGR_PEP_ID=MMETSP0126-20121128/29865_1 /TAXON_ID=141414 ORGANISM="Strombidinopsis acuminatum, Strain SPMC142" /NCGR_SAMPLE_ID=MMETSP0126 /ASSEMBLY_ACC=CAM_ASM_000229 /LENGTH=52 /DNA_ID=CAMNT_0017741229 /DNA_START=105 /DNA_END=266 /DNA_ORIENTATION=+